MTVRINADFNNTDGKGRVRLNTQGTFQDIERMNVKLAPDLVVLLDDNQGLSVYGTIMFSEEENIWVAKINRDEFTHYDV